MNTYKQKAAMFGLDARISLAIFGALSVIAGAALYNIIGQLETNKILAEMQEVGKAIEQYYLDTGVMLSRSDEAAPPLSTANLVENRDSVSNWRGPYINYDVLSYTDVPIGRGNIAYIAMYANGVDWDVLSIACVGNQQCYIYITSSGFDNTEDVFQKLDAVIDDSDGEHLGNLRLEGANIYLKIMPYSF